ncbi:MULTISPECIES: tetratricopeptide repeat protein [Prochlorococcus]|uniref:TPR-repeat protein n=1 Tax=Prochlorococcus marinus (strain SARG / CCMP1375 / SS120) TaxID=167539 RepID=Q7V9L0_PROMA|nr:MULTISPECIES: tetratricopeptide repeat protein [Prochlorococcus]AAQ00867.1 TPR-repeat protein [Prochlorococcus marinus subsp. marinus str. CCMP1375]KGG10639.1 photosystem I assembly related protein Ycf37 [Prochlorococcus marinus str. LG]KGG19895.1 photosystem I assembly related protein Ycf37 [Prochlorococcus marinus str. SS2]KGG23885.1 photosystem I assembly related protein Ycf37 [Prochlorococcus marinus str. SS35]KGG31855.1 photosystem I assembly related protein Ycf37 [Prochlorococcus mari
MPSSLPQTYLVILTSILLILAIVVGRQVLKVRRNEINLAKLEKSGAIDSSKSENLYELGSAQLKKRLYPQATISLKKALKQITDEPSEAKAIIENALGFSLAAQDKFNEAIKHYKNAIREKNDYPVAMNNLAFAKQKLLQEDEAYDLYKEVLEIDPNNKTAIKQLGKLNKRKKSSSENIIYKKGF